MKYDDMPHSNNIGNPVENIAIENMMYKHDCAIIEESAIRANPSIYRYILRSVTMNNSYEEIEYDEEYGKIPYGKTDFYGYRRLFFYYLHRIKIGDKMSEVM